MRTKKGDVSRMPSRSSRYWAIAAALAAMAAGCNQKSHSGADAGSANEALPVLAAVPIEKRVRDSVIFTGRTDAVQTIDVRARVTGYLVATDFKEGTEVKKDQRLFLVDPRPYEATLATDVAQIGVAQANLKLAEADYARAKEVAKTPGAISSQEVDKYAAQVDVCKAQLDQAKANADYARLNVEFCSVTAPIDGVVSRYLVTSGNLVNQDNTLLTTIVSTDPIYGYFDIDENTLLRVQRLVKEGKIKSATEGGDIEVDMGLADDDGFPIKGTVNFINNQLDPTTGTLQVRGTFANPLIKGRRALIPGLFVRVELFIGPEYDGILINERAVGTDLGLKFVYVVNDKDEIEYREVVLGEQHENLRVVSQGLKAGERILVTGLQRVKPGTKVAPKIIPMPLSTADPFVPKLNITPNASDKKTPM